GGPARVRRYREALRTPGATPRGSDPGVDSKACPDEGQRAYLPLRVPLMALEQVERLLTGGAGIEGLAGRGAELAHQFGVGAAALGARHHRCCAFQRADVRAVRRRRYAVGQKLTATAFRDPVRGPGRGD